ncbi:MAG: hypothetical protein GXD23_06520 [Comamonadaceae bacterium]|nr:hypothetical protein [Comamonadaceae bacterium]
MTYYHVFIRTQGDAGLRPFLKDLAPRDVKTRFVTPYLRNEKLASNGLIVPVDALLEVRVVASAKAFGPEYSEACEKAREARKRKPPIPGVLMLNVGLMENEMAEMLPNVTDKFLHGRPPGAGLRKGPLHLVSENPTLSAIIAALAVFAFGYFFGLRAA